MRQKRLTNSDLIITFVVVVGMMMLILITLFILIPEYMAWKYENIYPHCPRCSMIELMDPSGGGDSNIGNVIEIGLKLFFTALIVFVFVMIFYVIFRMFLPKDPRKGFV